MTSLAGISIHQPAYQKVVEAANVPVDRVNIEDKRYTLYEQQKRKILIAP